MNDIIDGELIYHDVNDENSPVYDPLFQDQKQRRDRDERERDIRKIADLYIKGYTRNEIRAAVNSQYPPERHLSPRAIECDLRVVLDEWRADSVRNIAEKQAEQLSKLRAVERELWEAWEKSKSVKEVVITEANISGKTKDEFGANRRRVQTRREQAIGDPRYLEGVMKVIEQRSRLLGLNQPEVLEINLIREMNNDELEQLIRQTTEAVATLAANTVSESTKYEREVVEGNPSDGAEGSESQGTYGQS